jgi:HlyD family secretion protein
MRAPPLLALVAALAIVGGGYAYWTHEQGLRLPPGLASANGRIEVERVDVATKVAGRVAEVAVHEGDFVQQGEVVARMDTTELRAQLAAAKASVRRTVQAIAKAEADIVIREAEYRLTEIELRRATELASRQAGPVAEVDRRRAQHSVNAAMVLGAKATLGDAGAAKEVAEAQVAQLEATLADMTLRAPVAGRVEYRLAQPGEVLPPGGRVATLLDLTEVYMTIFLPTGSAGRVAHGSEARIVLDAAPEYVVPARVSFVAAEAQFTPKAVETANEREKLMYRVKIAVDPKLLDTYRDYVRAGLTGNAYVKIRSDAAWPDHLSAPKLPNVAHR